MYSLESPLISTHNIHVLDKKISLSLNICFLELSEDFYGNSLTVNVSSVLESSVFESLSFTDIVCACAEVFVVGVTLAMLNKLRCLAIF